MRQFVYLKSIVFMLVLGLTATAWCTEHNSDSAADILVRAGVKTKEKIWLGQRLILHVDVLAPDGWAQIKSIRDFTVEGSQVVRYESQGTRLNETIQSQTFSDQRYEMSLFPRRAGTLTVPPIPVEVEISSWGSKEGKQSKRLQTPEVTLQVQAPPGAEDIKGLISAPELTATQKCEPNQNKFKVGDAIKRTIELKGSDISGMAFTPLHFESSDMVSVYPAQPRVDDSFDRGSLSCKRVETATYVFAREGTVELPKIVIPWWDINKKKLHKEVLPAMKLKIAPSPTASSGETGSGKAQEQTISLPRWLYLALISLAVLLALTVFYMQRIRSWWTQWQQTRHEQESYFFKQFTERAYSNDPKAAFNSLMRWLDRIHTGPGAARLDKILKQYGNEKSLAEAGRLEQALSEGSTGWSGKPFAETIDPARQQ